MGHGQPPGPFYVSHLHIYYKTVIDRDTHGLMHVRRHPLIACREREITIKYYRALSSRLYLYLVSLISGGPAVDIGRRAPLSRSGVFGGQGCLLAPTAIRCPKDYMRMKGPRRPWKAAGGGGEGVWASNKY